jgi:hypothetical protein
MVGQEEKQRREQEGWAGTEQQRQGWVEQQGQVWRQKTEQVRCQRLEEEKFHGAVRGWRRKHFMGRGFALVQMRLVLGERVLAEKSGTTSGSGPRTLTKV